MQHVRAGLAAAVFATAATASGPDAAATARASVVATDLANQSTVAFCDERAPGQAAKIRAAWTEWRQRNDVEAVTRRTDPAWIEKVRQSVASNEAALHAKMAERGAPDVVCAALPAAWREAGMDLRARYPLAYAEAASPSNAPQVASAGGTVFTVAQLQRHYATGSLDERRSRLRAPLFVKGTAVKRGDRWFLVQDDGTWVARLSVAPGFSLAAYEGREIVLAGTLNELPSTVAFLQDGRVVADPSRLVAATGSDADWLVRKGVPLDRVRTKPGGGVGSGDIEAVLFSGKAAMLLLDDGWLYDRPGAPPPSDLDVKASRDLEPQHWHRWKSAGGGKYLVRRADARGRLSEDWKPVTGMWRVKPWPDGPSIEGGFARSDFYGSIATGGTYTKQVWFFKRDGRFSSLGFSQSGAGSMAAMNGFTAGQTTVRDTKGSQTSGFASGGGVTVSNQRAGGDGAGNRGTYTVDRYALELHFDNGQVARVFSFPWDDKRTSAWINDAAYLEDK
jgi:hypothetical protein